MIAILRDAKTNLQNQIQEEIITNQNLQQIIDNFRKNVIADPYFYNLISGRTDSRNLLIQAIGESQTSLVIVCPWIKDSALNKPVNNSIKEELENALKRGVNILIGWGYLGDVRGSIKSLTRDKLLKSRSRMFYTGIEILEELQKKYPEQLRLYVLGTHEKFLVVDESYCFIGSHNFLTSDDSSDERELGIHTNNLDIIKELINTFNEASSKSIEELPNTFNETSVEFINSAVTKTIKPCQEVRPKKIIIPKMIVPNIVETYAEKITQEIELKMVILPIGSFLMGSDDNDRMAFYNEKPQHQVTINQFAIAKYPVTQEQYQAIMESNPSRCKDNPKNPVDSITWNDAQIFCQKLSQKTGKNYRLPSESEWEYACRAGTKTRYYFGDNERRLDKYAWHDRSTHPVGEKKPNNWGLYDMHGNVWEWCEDGWHEDYQNAPKDGTAWNDNHSQTDRRVLRGGSSFVYERILRSAFRCTYDFRDGYYGFRVAVSIP